ncbi:MAG: hypothetical protein V4583_20525 [Pseudomonadota bacterium]
MTIVAGVRPAVVVVAATMTMTVADVPADRRRAVAGLQAADVAAAMTASVTVSAGS